MPVALVRQVIGAAVRADPSQSGAGVDATDAGDRLPHHRDSSIGSLLWQDGEALLVVVATGECQLPAPVRVIQCTERRP